MPREWGRALGSAPQRLLEAVSSSPGPERRGREERPLPFMEPENTCAAGPPQSRAALQVILITLAVAAAAWVLYRLERVVPGGGERRAVVLK